jgi:hypothetical protein
MSLVDHGINTIGQLYQTNKWGGCLAFDPVSMKIFSTDLKYGGMLCHNSLGAGVGSCFAGSEQSGYKDGPGSNASFNVISSIEVDPLTSQLIVADTLNHRIRLVHSVTGLTSTLAGNHLHESIDGKGTDASFRKIFDFAFDPFSRQVIVADYDEIRLVGMDTGAVVTVARMCKIMAIAFDPLQGRILAASSDKNVINLITNCGLVGVLEWEAHVKQVLCDMANDQHTTVAFMPTVLVDIILYYTNYSYGRKRIKV